MSACSFADDRGYSARTPLPLSEAPKPSMTSLTSRQLFSSFMRPSQRLTFGKSAKSLPVSSASATKDAAK